MDMEVGLKIITKRVEDENHADGEFLFLREDVVDNFGGRV